jgi:hypothetical protein
MDSTTLIPYAYNLVVVLTAATLTYFKALDPQLTAAILGGALVHGASIPIASAVKSLQTTQPAEK